MSETLFEMEAIPATETGVAMEVSRVKDSVTYLSLARRTFQIEAGVRDLKVTDDTTDALAMNYIADVMTAKEEAEKFRKAITFWPRKLVELVNGNFKILTDNLDKQRPKVEALRRAYAFQKDLAERKRQAELKREMEKANERLVKKGLEPVDIPIPATTPSATTVRTEAGTSYEAEEWHWKETNLMLLVKAVAAGTENVEALQVNEKYMQGKIDAGVRKIPGIKIFCEKVLKFRRAR